MWGRLLKWVFGHNRRVIVSPNGRQYSSDSFDRFGDDLSELLLSYLCFDDKFAFEYVSKQWRRLVFNKVIHFENVYSIKYLWHKYFDDNDFKTALKKCQNLKTIKLYVNSETVSSLPLLSDNCHRLKSIKLYVESEVSSKALTEFCETFGTKVEEIDVWDQSNNISILNWCQNLKLLSSNGSNWLCLVDNQLVPTLNTLSTVYVDSDRMSALRQLVDKYQNTMQMISVNVYMSDEEEDILSEVFQQLSRLKNLESLRLTLDSYIVYLDLIPDITYLCQHCPKLNMLNLKISPGFIKSSHSSKSSKGLKKLNIHCYDMTENFFDIISDLAPNLKEFIFTSYANNSYSNKHLNDLSRMKRLKRLKLKSKDRKIHPIDDSAVIQLLDNCPKLIELELNFRSNITVKTIDKLKELANKRPKERFRFLTKFCGNKSKVRRLIKKIPNNLNIDSID